jgi:hypothetical protein
MAPKEETAPVGRNLDPCGFQGRFEPAELGGGGGQYAGRDRHSRQATGAVSWTSRTDPRPQTTLTRLAEMNNVVGTNT